MEGGGSDARTRRLGIAVVLLVVAGVVVLLVTRNGPVRMDGSGTVYRHLWCLGIQFDGEPAYPVHAWPDGYRAQTIPDDDPQVVLRDAAGEVVLRVGDRVIATAMRYHADGGDTACAHLDSLEVESFEVAGR